jgi:hypothetical protein
MNDDSMYLTLSSGIYSGCQGLSASDFETTLYKPISLSKDLYEIGVAEVIYKPVKEVIDGNDLNFTVWKGKDATMHFNLIKRNSLLADISTFNEFFKREKLQIIVEINAGKDTKYNIKTEYPEERYIQFSDTCRKILGFQKVEYKAGDIMSELPEDVEEYDNLELGAMFGFTIVTKRYHKQLKLEGPVDKDITELCTEINVALRNQSIPIEFSVEQKNIKVDSEDSALKIQFSETLDRILGSPGIITGAETELEKIDLHRGNQLIYLYCNLISPQIIGGHCDQIIKTFIQSRQNYPIVSTSFFPIQYCNLKVNEFSSVRIRATNESGHPIPFESEQGLTVVLHIKLKSNV